MSKKTKKLINKKIRTNFSYLEGHLPLERFIPIVFILFLLIFILLSIITYNHIKQYKENVEAVNLSYEILGKKQRISNFFLHIPLTCQNFLLTGDNKYLTTFYDSQKKVKEEIKDLAALVQEKEQQKTDVLKLDSLANGLLLVFNSAVEDYEQKKYLNEPRVISLSNTDSQIEDIMEILRQIKNNESDILAGRNTDMANSSYNIQVFIILTSLFAFCVIGLALYLSNKLIKNKTSTEELLQKSYDELEDRVEERTAELKSVNEDLLSEISNRIKIESLLRESEERFRVMADSAPIMIWMSGKDKLCTYFNNGWLEFSGRTFEQELGNGWSEGVHPDDMQRCFDTYILAFDKRENFEMEYRLKNANGEYRWILDKGIPRFEGDEFSGYIGCCIDIQSRKMNERFLNLQHAVSKTLVDAASIEETSLKALNNICSGIYWQFGIIWLLNENKDKLKPQVIWSKNSVHHKEFSRIYDHEIQQGIDLPGLVWKSSKSVWSANLMKDHNFERKDLAYRLSWNSAFAIPVTNGTEIIAVIECFNNEIISPKPDLLTELEAIGRQIGNYLERKKTEEILKHSHTELENRVNERTKELGAMMNKLLKEIEQKEKIQNKLKLFGHTIKGIKECVYITDLENKILFVNSAFESVFGYFEEELLNKEVPVLFSDDILPETRNNILTSTIRSGWRGELLSKCKDGSQFYIYLSTSVIRNDEGKIEAIVGICQDITDSKAAEELAIKQNSLIKLLNDIIAVTNKSFDLKNSISYTINKICQYTSWDVGHCYLMAESGKLQSSSIWNYNLNKKYNEIKDVSETMVFEPGKGFVGETFKAGKSAWILLKKEDVKRYPRAESLMEAGLLTCIIIPIIKQNEPIGVLEFFKTGNVNIENDILECISNIGIELGGLAERIEILEKIKVSEKQFKAVSDTANDAIITSNSKGKVVYVNRSAEKIFGYSNDEFLNSDLSILIPDNLIINHQTAFEKAVESGELLTHGKTVEFTAKNKLSREFPVEISIAKWEINREMFFTAMIKDITVRKEIETELIEKQRMLVEAQQISRLGSWEWDVASNTVTWSEGMYKVYELNEREFKPTYEGFLERVHPDDVEYVKNIISDAFNNKESFNYYHRIVIPEGKVKTLKAQGEIILDDSGNIVKMFGTGLDITEIKEAEDKIRLSESQLKESQQIAKLGSWEYNLLTGEQFWSDELFRICSFDKENGIPSFESVIELIHPEDKERVNSLLSSMKENPRNVELSFRIATLTGVLKYIDTDILIGTDENSKVIRYYGSIQDVTEIKIVEQELRKANEKLLEAQKELIHSEKLAALGRFSSGIAHEIRNPLANISALSQLVSKAKLDEKSQKHLKYILINADIANNIIKDLLNFASPDEPVFNNENIDEIIENVLESIAPRCVENKINIVKHISKSIPKVYVDKLRIENALMNFVSNALDAMPDGGDLTVKTFTDKINHSLNISISDTGSGISQDNLDKILEPFFTTKKNGTGLGLGLAYQAVKSHNGNVKIESSPGSGTVVNINLPLNNIK
ncbi:MAG TPA: PAS domain S-box protein [Ignavibacteria bacterium]|nr:PAS domain S-box protein [Ignavibacteria bacterium]